MNQKAVRGVLMRALLHQQASGEETVNPQLMSRIHQRSKSFLRCVCNQHRICPVMKCINFQFPLSRVPAWRNLELCVKKDQFKAPWELKEVLSEDFPEYFPEYDFTKDIDWIKIKEWGRRNKRTRRNGS